MNWIQENLNTIATLGAAWAVYFFLRKPIGNIETKLEKIDQKISSLDSRISRIEGQLTGVYHWEPKYEIRPEDKKTK